MAGYGIKGFDTGEADNAFVRPALVLRWPTMDWRVGSSCKVTGMDVTMFP